VDRQHVDIQVDILSFVEILAMAAGQRLLGQVSAFTMLAPLQDVLPCCVSRVGETQASNKSV
jgi:hypothetical protein